MEGTLEGRINNTVSDLKTNGSEDELNDYLLKCIPFIKEYGSKERNETYSHDSQNVLDTLFNTTSTVSRKTENNIIYKRYLHDVEQKFEDTPYTSDTRVGAACKNCGCDDFRYSLADSTEICTNCGASNFVFSEHNISFKEEQDMETVPIYSYKRENHFNEWINQFQGQEQTNIPDEVIDKLRYEFKKQRLARLSDITHAKVRSLLKKLRMHKYYEHVPYITIILNGIKPPRMTPSLEQKLRQMFHEIQQPFKVHCPPERKNFLSYSYVLYKFCELLGQDEFLPCFPLLKSKEKLLLQDRIWKGITKDLQWEYIPTV